MLLRLEKKMMDIALVSETDIQKRSPNVIMQNVIKTWKNKKNLTDLIKVSVQVFRFKPGKNGVSMRDLLKMSRVTVGRAMIESLALAADWRVKKVRSLPHITDFTR